MQVSRGIEGSVEEVSRKMLVDSWGVEKVSRNNTSESRTEARSIHQGSRSYRGGRNFLDRSTKYRGGVKIALRKKAWEARQMARYRGGVEEVSSKLFKTVFREKKNTDMNAIQHTTQPMIQSTQKSLKIVSQSKKILSTRISKTHTHTH